MRAVSARYNSTASNSPNDNSRPAQTHFGFRTVDENVKEDLG